MMIAEVAGVGEDGQKLGDGWCWGQYMAGPGVNILINPKLAKTGKGFRELREKLKEGYPPAGIARFPQDGLQKVVCCVRCGDIPHPENALACEEGHYTCGECVKSGLVKAKKKKCDLENCCLDLCTLNKEGADFLEFLLSCLEFKCRNWEKGCEERVQGDMMDEHYENCKFTELVKCRYHQCTEKYAYLDDVLEHYKEVHQATILQEPGNSIKLPPIDFKQTVAQRLCAILKIEGLYYVFACEVVNNSVYIWMWSMEHPPSPEGNGLKTDAWYNLKLKMPPGKVPVKMGKGLGSFEGRCLVFSVDPESICMIDGGITESLTIDLELFKKMFVDEEAHGGNGGWTVAVLVRSSDGGSGGKLRK